MSEKPNENWGSSGPYEQYVGRWSRKVAEQFLAWLAVRPEQMWSDIGCGTGALTETILADFNPQSIIATDRAESFIAEARRRISDPRVRFAVGDATTLPWATGSLDVTVSGLVLNFVTDADHMTKEMVRVTRAGGKVAAYVWDYAGGMQMMRHFWDVAVELNPNDAALDQAERFPLCQPEPLAELFRRSGLSSISVLCIDIPTVFRNFEDYWRPFLGKQGAAPAYLASLNDRMRDQIRDTLKARLHPNSDGSITMTARAWAAGGIV